MNKWTSLLMSIVTLISQPSKADFWGGDLPLLAQIVTNTMNTLSELQQQSSMLRDETRGINDRINRIQTIASVVQPSSWDRWRDPAEALRRLKLIYHTIPKEYRSEKSDQIEEEISKAMNLIARVSHSADASFSSGKEMEERGKSVSPGVAQKLTASGVGTLISMEAQTQIIQSHILSLLTQSFAEANERESRLIESRGSSFGSFHENLGNDDGVFSSRALAPKVTL